MKIFRFETIDSTFVEAGRRMNELPNGAYLFTAREQTAGRGQGTHTFYSPKDNGFERQVKNIRKEKGIK